MSIMSEPLPPHLATFERYSLPAVERKLSEALDLAWDSSMQDWNFVNANPDILPQLVDLLVNQVLSDDEQFSAMCLAVASYDEALLGGATDETIWSSLEERMTMRPELYVSIVWYWAQPALRGEESFAVSAAMTGVWKKVNERIRAGRCSGN
jgi:hypothetical protein